MKSAPVKEGQALGMPVALAPHGLLPAIASLSLGGLFIGTAEFASMSLLPALAKATQVSIPEAGSYISAYALGVVVGAPLLAVLAAKRPRKAVLINLLFLFVVASVASALAWDSSSLLLARFVSGLPHGAYYGVASLVAAALVPESKRAQAIGYVMLGLAAANVVGVPLATWLGQTFGWRSAFVSMALGGLVTLVLIRSCVPALAPPTGGSPMKELSALRRPQVWLTLAVASIGFGGMFAVYSYITPTLTAVTGFSESAVPAVLSLWGLGMVFGNLIGGWAADRALVPAILAILAWNVIFLCLFAVFASQRIPTLGLLFLIGNGFALVPALQARLMEVGGDAQTLAASLNHSAFNLSNAIGAAAGGASIASGFGWASTGWVGGGLGLAGLVLMSASGLIERNQNE